MLKTEQNGKRGRIRDDRGSTDVRLSAHRDVERNQSSNRSRGDSAVKYNPWKSKNSKSKKRKNRSFSGVITGNGKAKDVLRMEQTAANPYEITKGHGNSVKTTGRQNRRSGSTARRKTIGDKQSNPSAVYDRRLGNGKPKNLPVTPLKASFSKVEFGDKSGVFKKLADGFTGFMSFSRKKSLDVDRLAEEKAAQELKNLERKKRSIGGSGLWQGHSKI